MTCCHCHEQKSHGENQRTKFSSLTLEGNGGATWIKMRFVA